MVAKRIASLFAGVRVGVHARLHDRGMQVQIVRHHRGAEDADGDVEHVRIAQDFRGGHEAAEHPAQVRPRQEELDGEAAGDPENEGDDDALEDAEAVLLHEQHDEHVERGDDDARHERDAEEQVERDGGADHLREVARRDGDFRQHPEHDRRPARVVGPAGLGQVVAGADAEPHGQRLQQDRHQVRQQDHAEQRVAEPRPAGDVGGPVARVHVADRDEVARARKREQLAPETGGHWNRHRPVRFREALLGRFNAHGVSLHQGHRAWDMGHGTWGSEAALRRLPALQAERPRGRRANGRQSSSLYPQRPS